MQKWVLQNRNHWMVMTGIFILISFGLKMLSVPGKISTYFLIGASLIGGLPIAIQAVQALRVKVISIDVLVTLAIAGAFGIRSFEESSIVSFLFLFGAYLEQKTLAKTRSAIQSLVEMAPASAWRKNKSGEFEEVAIDEVVKGDTLLVKTGSQIPVDGEVTFGNGIVNEAGITGESIPVEKSVGDKVFAGTILENGALQLKAEKVGEDTTFGKIIELVEEAQDSKSKTERFIDQFSKYYTPIVLMLGIVVWLWTKDIAMATTILVLGCPGALVIGVPVSNVSGIGKGARQGILFKGSDVIGKFAQTDTILFDKTGTLTYGNPQVVRTVYTSQDHQLATELLISVEKESSHPLAKAILNEYSSDQTHVVQSSAVMQGGGIVAQVDEHDVLVGNVGLMHKHHIVLDAKTKRDIASMEADGNSTVLLAVDGQLAMAVGIRDQIRAGVKEDIQALQKMGVKNLILLSGDQPMAVELVCQELELTEARGNMLPQDKATYVKARKEMGEIVAFVGDGINDSPSLAEADIGIAMGDGTDAAIETSDVVLMHSDIHRLPDAFRLAKATRRNRIENMGIALFVVVVLLVSLFASDWMNMEIGMFVHESSILVVIMNAMRLLYDKKIGFLDRNQLWISKLWLN
ncbi:heavy metal translocating P-type ATPase [Absicoccus intestinalis]|uniref:Cd(2+)-exporting ATPase n=1 Tax=Absicoccus intestinalis TaxID=2926319 RepID=A0ABU4WMX0_9FIRM|nr:cation-translocating P-type ATPase [Absicoccus sp. CLA-KB-P134]MDX8417118.1 cation-translocating P-type ATPase [Absicoccus sp. CLA-KB-P134]